MAYVPVALLLLAFVTGASVSDHPGSLTATPVRVIDGDTIEVDAAVWPGHTVRASVRLRGIDAPELRGACEAEKALAVDARDHLVSLVSGRVLRLTDIERDKFFGRVVASVWSADGVDLSAAMRVAGFAYAYDGGTRRGWCDGPKRHMAGAPE